MVPVGPVVVDPEFVTHADGVGQGPDPGRVKASGRTHPKEGLPVADPPELPSVPAHQQAHVHGAWTQSGNGRPRLPVPEGLGQHDVDLFRFLVPEDVGAVVVHRRLPRGRGMGRSIDFVGPHHDALIGPMEEIPGFQAADRTKIPVPVVELGPVPGEQEVTRRRRIPEDDALGVPATWTRVQLGKQLPSNTVRRGVKMKFGGRVDLGLRLEPVFRRSVGIDPDGRASDLAGDHNVVLAGAARIVKSQTGFDERQSVFGLGVADSQHVREAVFAVLALVVPEADLSVFLQHAGIEADGATPAGTFPALVRLQEDSPILPGRVHGEPDPVTRFDEALIHKQLLAGTHVDGLGCGAEAGACQYQEE